MTKREFKEKCKKEKTTSYKLILAGGIVAIVGFVIVVATFLVLNTSLIQTIGFALGAIVAVVGIALDVVGEYMISKAFKNYYN